MALNNNNKTIIEERKALVASLRLKGLSQREIVSNLTIQKKLNPKTGNPWSLGIINKDIADIEARWRESCSKDIGEHKARVKKHAWKATEFAVVLKAIDQESHLLGTRAAIKQELTGKDGKAIEVSASVQVYIPDNGRNDRD